ncbi:transmembrane and coiled-coil domains protein, putative [Pediculus humanus corporis]|uniref:Transmembrane and coiled-coil domains protein, putative n=1 Tax=Pediculus humanus subsp. corporis TaxID=121224 RepID=E0VDV9_PEDHC|nr:transmembrane and coiled-coil domains protein, putative [Pediculus humanus corporis]EEB11565.1 transmembrane and coiled-coil domains protein, putative [Pediculus humanus corporis]
MDNLQVVSGKGRPINRNVSPIRQSFNNMSGITSSPGPSGMKVSQNVLRSGDGNGSSGSGSVACIGSSSSSSGKHRRKSPTILKREIESTTPHIPSADLLPGKSLEESITFDDSDVYIHSSSLASNGSSEQVLMADEPDSQVPDMHRQRSAAIEHIQSKISKTMDQIRAEQTTRDDNVNEFIKLATNADKQQIQRIKSVFEKKNQKSAQIISQLQKKLETYNKRIRDIESQKLHTSHRQPREVLRDMGQGLKNVGGNIRDGISGLSGTVMSKPREFAHLLKNKFGSADNINSLSRNGENGSTGEEDKTHHGSATLPGNCTLTTTTTTTATTVTTQGSTPGNTKKFASDEGSPCSSVTSESLHLGQVTHHHTSPRHNRTSYNLDPLFRELQERREEIEILKEKLENLKGVHQEIQYLTMAIQEEKFRSERLEEQINDLTELHQNEVENLKQALTDMEEKVQYQSEERIRDLHEMLENCQTKISKMEHQQAQHQQYVTLEGIDNSNARAVVVKLINVLLTVLQVVLLLVATAAGILMPFLKTRLRILSTLVLIAATVFVLKQWPEVRDVGNHLIRHIKEAVSVK